MRHIRVYVRGEGDQLITIENGRIFNRKPKFGDAADIAALAFLKEEEEFLRKISGSKKDIISATYDNGRLLCGHCWHCKQMDMDKFDPNEYTKRHFMICAKCKNISHCFY